MYAMKLRYGETLLGLIRREAMRRGFLGSPDMARIHDLCDRFERVAASLRVAPLTWDGDYT